MTIVAVRHRLPAKDHEANAALIVTAVNALEPMKAALEMIRDADEDCKRDGLPTIPPMARAKIDAALRLVDGCTK